MAVMRGLTIGIVSLWLALCLGCVASAPQVPVSKAEGPMSGLKVRIESGSATANDDHAAGWYQAVLRSFRQAALKAGLRVVDGEDYAVRVVVHGDKVESGILQAPPQKNPTTGQVTQAAPVGPRYLTESSVVRAQLFARGTNELIDEVTFRIGETIDGNVELDGSDGFVAAELINRVLGAVGVPPVTRRVPPKLAYAAGWVAEKVYGALGRQEEPPITRFAAEQLMTSHFFDISAAERDLGWTPSVSFEDGLERLRRAHDDGYLA